MVLDSDDGKLALGKGVLPWPCMSHAYLSSFRIITCVVDAARELMGCKYLPLEFVVEENHGTKVVLVPTLGLRGK